MLYRPNYQVLRVSNCSFYTNIFLFQGHGHSSASQKLMSNTKTPNSSDDQEYSSFMSCVVNLSPGDEIYMRAQVAGSNYIIDSKRNATYFGLILLKRRWLGWTQKTLPTGETKIKFTTEHILCNIILTLIQKAQGTLVHCLVVNIYFHFLCYFISFGSLNLYFHFLCYFISFGYM